jgi:hypothetical protein
MEDEGSEEPPAPGTEEDTPLKPSTQTTAVTSQVTMPLALNVVMGLDSDWHALLQKDLFCSANKNVFVSESS